MTLSTILPTKIRLLWGTLKPTLQHIEVALPLQWHHVSRLGVDECACNSSKPALEAHVGATAERQKRLVDIRNLQVDLAR